MISADLRQEFARELQHWKTATERLADADSVASPQAWQALEHYLGVSLRQALATVMARLRRVVQDFDVFLRTASADTAVEQFQSRLVGLRQAYLRAETTVDYYSDAIAMRSIPKLAALLRACDHIATRSMAEALTPMGREVPSVLTYIDKGMGASILKAGLRLWDGTAENPVATIKVTRHNVLRGASGALIHEAGHQVAHMLGWIPELAERLAGGLGRLVREPFGQAGRRRSPLTLSPTCIRGTLPRWHFHDVLDGADETSSFSISLEILIPISYLRVLMAIDMCRRTFGPGPWDRLAANWRLKHRIERSPGDIRSALEASVRAMPRIVDIVLNAPYRAFGGDLSRS